jgi:hypothetical protein
MQSNLDISIEATHEVLRGRLKAALAAQGVPQHSRGEYPLTDDFLASTSRHLAAISSVLLPQVHHHLPTGGERAKEFVGQSRRLELALSQIKAKLYGEAHAIHRTWGEVWAGARREFEQTLVLERQLVDDLMGALTAENLDALASKVYHAELHSPTRPHPYAPHQGLGGRISRSLLNRVDHFWDSTEGRMVPEPVQPRDHSHDGLITHYLLADTDPEEEPEHQPEEESG